jgi:hypothetical protein
MATTEVEQFALSDEQKAVLELIYQKAWKTGAWPAFWIVDRPLRELCADPQTTLQSLIPRYALRDGRGSFFQSQEVLRVTLRGINELLERDIVIPLFLQVLGFLVWEEENYEPTREQPEPRVSETDVAHFLKNWGRPLGQAERIASRLGLLIYDEASKWWCSPSIAPDGHWSVTLSSEIRRYKNVESIEDYFEATPQYSPEQPQIGGALQDQQVPQSENAHVEVIKPVHKSLRFLGRWTEQIVIGVIIVVVGGLLLLLITHG